MKKKENNYEVIFYPHERYWIVFLGFWAAIFGTAILWHGYTKNIQSTYGETFVLFLFFLWAISLIKYTSVSIGKESVETRSNFFFYRRVISLKSITLIDSYGSLSMPYLGIHYTSDDKEEVLNFPVGFFEPKRVVVQLIEELKKRNPAIQLHETTREYLKRMKSNGKQG